MLAELDEKRMYPRRLSKAMGGPLTPQERPLVLPGGRKWRNERDAFNEDFIAEIISSQAELIMGSTLGYESPSNLFHIAATLLYLSRCLTTVSF